ncbi:MAG: sodium:solute symporter family protein, partial [Anaerococcus hydrogenalis]|nr:sodium:solute symporter family protein [Anaerococcus hydrogenalis]
MLLSCSQIVSQDLIFFHRKDKISDDKNLKISRIIIVIIAIVGAVIAINPPKALVQVVQDVAYTGLAQLAPAFILGLYWKNSTKEGAAFGISVGIILLFAFRIFKLSPLNVPGFLWAFVINIILNIIVSIIYKNKINKKRVEKRFF